jgi:glycosyltransferase involved in cell wall biosynthesis
MKILIALSTYNRPIITQLCLENLQAVRSDKTKLIVYDDASTAYDKDFLLNYADEVVRFEYNVSIRYSRGRAIRDFVSKYLDYDLIYFTDNDTIHDPSFIDIIETIMDSQNSFPEPRPFGLFHSKFHYDNENIISETDQFVFQKTMPGVSHGYTREMAEIIVNALTSDPDTENTPHLNWDLIYPSVLNRPCLLPKKSYLEHFARDRFESGIHSNYSGLGPEAMADFERDRALNPTDFLVNIRDSIINKILGKNESTN